MLSTPNGAVTNPGGGKPDNPYHVREYLLPDLIKVVESQFRIVDIYGQYPKGIVPRISSVIKSSKYLKNFYLSLLSKIFKKESGEPILSKKEYEIKKGKYRFSLVLIIHAVKK